MRSLVVGGVAAVYLGFTLWLSYAVWGPYDGVEHDPAWADGTGLTLILFVLHVAAGVLIGRWAFALPLAWCVLSIPAGGYDTPVWIGIAFTLIYWLPAAALGLGGGGLERELA